MSPRTAATPPQLPDELMESMHRIASITGSASQPWPAVDQTINRQHRRRVALAAASLAVVLAAGVGATSMILSPAAVKSSAASQSLATGNRLAPELRRAGYAGAVGGSLADDQDFVDQARVRIAAGVSAREGRAVTAADVIVFYAGDLDGRRMVVAGYPPASTVETILTILTFTGAKGADAGFLSALPGQITDVGRGILGRPVPLVIMSPAAAPATAEDHGVVFVIAPNSKRVELAVARRFLPGGEVKDTWQPMQKQGGSTWVSTAGPEALRIARFRADRNEEDLPPSLDVVPLKNLNEVAAPGTDQTALEEARMVLTPLGLSGSETPVLAATNNAGAYPLTAVMLRSPDNGYVGSVDVTVKGATTQHPSTVAASAIFNGEFAGPDDAMAVVEIRNILDKAGPLVLGYAVIAPKGATTVQMGQDSAEVKNRVAFLTIPADRFAETGGGSMLDLPITALDASGKELATVQSQEGMNATLSER